MTAVMNIFLSFLMLFSGMASQAGFLAHPAKYNAKAIKTSDLPAPVTQTETDDYIQLSEVRMHYRVYGKEKPPLLLIHGNGGNADSLREAATYLANDYTVYVPESRCHGGSSDPGEITYALMAKDFKEFIDALRLEKPVVMGHSDGAINAIELAADYPDVPGAIIACGANSHPKMFKPYFPLGVAIRNLFRRDKLNDLMLTLPDFTPEYLSQITCPRISSAVNLTLGGYPIPSISHRTSRRAIWRSSRAKHTVPTCRKTARKHMSSRMNGCRQSSSSHKRRIKKEIVCSNSNKNAVKL